MSDVDLKALHLITVRDKKGQPAEAVLELRYRRIRVLPPIGKQNRYPELRLTVIYAQERETPKGRDPIDWKLITDLPVSSPLEAIEKLEWYASRWKIETFHKILKSGCKAETSKLRTADRLVNLIAVFCILSWRIFWMTMLNRSTSQAPASIALTDAECQLLDRLIPDKQKTPSRKKSLSSYITKVARLGGYLARANDSPPGNTVMWRGLARLTDIEIGFDLAKDVGN
jgi:Transposase Tn5 dimerisation domain